MSGLDMDKIGVDNEAIKLSRMKADFALDDLIRARKQNPDHLAVSFVVEVAVLVGRMIAADNVHRQVYGSTTGQKSTKELIDSIVEGLII
jgi:hypothetical protein